MDWIEDRDDRLAALLTIAGNEHSGTGSEAGGSPQSKCANLIAWWVRQGRLDPIEVDHALGVARHALDEDREVGLGHSLERAVVVLTRAVELADRPPAPGWE